MSQIKFLLEICLEVIKAINKIVGVIVKLLNYVTSVLFTSVPATVHRPWGTYSTLYKDDSCLIKRITVAPGQKLSLQYHHKRAEHWVVTKGKALVKIGDDDFETFYGEHRFIPIGEQHRLTNIGDDELVLIEVQVGTYFGEDDIVRIEDIYGRK